MAKIISNYDDLPTQNRKVYDLILAESDGSVNAFADRIKVSQQTLDRIFKKDIRNGKYPSVSDKIKSGIKEVFGVDEVWFVAEEDKKIQAETPTISYTTGVPYYNIDFLGGFDLVANCQNATPEYLIDFKKYNKATCWCNVTGHSMEPEITHGDIIALREIKDTSFLPLGEVYAIVTTNEMRTIKRLGAGSDKDHYSLVPTNKSPEYGVQEIPKSMVYKVFSVLGCMKRL